MDSYQSLSAQVYNFDKPIGKSFGDIEYYLSRIQNSHQAILEPAVGTGRIFIPLLEAHYDMHGFDLSYEMLEHCQQNLSEHNLPPTRIKHASFTNFQYSQEFGGIIIPSGTFLLITDYADIKLTLQKFYDHLTVDGQLVFDLFFQHDFQLGRTKFRTFEFSSLEKITLTMLESEIDYADQIATYHHRYELWHNNQLKDTELETFKLKWLGIEEIKLLLESTGFSDITFSADYQYLKPIDNTCDIFTVEAFKR